MPPSTDSLIQLTYRYYPRLGDALYRLPAQEYDELYQSTPEYQALLAVQENAIQDRTLWRAFLAVVQEALPRNALIDTTRGGHDVCYTARIDVVTHETPRKIDTYLTVNLGPKARRAFMTAADEIRQAERERQEQRQAQLIQELQVSQQQRIQEIGA